MAEYFAGGHLRFVDGEWRDDDGNMIEISPVRHGRWVEYQIPHIICCSNCDWATGIEEKNFQYCPNCGAKMDGGAAMRTVDGGKET